MKVDHGLVEEQISIVVKQTVAALEYVHSLGIIHRDLKAGNILLMNNGEVKLADFGVSALNEDREKMRDTFIGKTFYLEIKAKNNLFFIPYKECEIISEIPRSKA